jgi:hypothetical protein
MISDDISMNSDTKPSATTVRGTAPRLWRVGSFRAFSSTDIALTSDIAGEFNSGQTDRLRSEDVPDRKFRACG